MLNTNEASRSVCSNILNRRIIPHELTQALLRFSIVPSPAVH